MSLRVRRKGSGFELISLFIVRQFKKIKQYSNHENYSNSFVTVVVKIIGSESCFDCCTMEEPLVGCLPYSSC